MNMKAVIEKKRILLCLFFTCLLAYLLLWSGHHYSIDGMLMFQSAKALAFKGSFRMEPPVAWGSQVFRVSKYGIGLPVLYVPVLWLMEMTFFKGDPAVRNTPFQADLPFNEALLADPAYRYASLLHPLVTALTAVLLYLFSVRLGFSEKKSAAVALIFGLASPALPYAKFDYSQPLCAFFLLGAFYCLVAARKSGKDKWLILAGISSGMLVLTRNEFLLFQFNLLLAGVYWLNFQGKLDRMGPQARAVALYFCSAAPFIISLFVVNRLRFGSWISMGYPASKIASGVLRPFYALTGNLVSPGRGMLVFFPAALFSFFCWPQLRKNKIIAVMLASVAAAFLLYSTWKNWGAGVCWGPRFMIPYLPLLSILSLAGFESMAILSARVKAFAGIFLVALGGIFNLQGSLFDFLPYYVAVFKSGVQLGYGDYNFVWRYSPLVNGWGGVPHPEQYDLFWLRHSGGVNGSLLFPLLLGIGISALLVFWWNFFRRPLRA